MLSNTKNSASGPKNAVSPTPDDFRYASAFFAVERGSRLYGCPVDGSTMSQNRIRLGLAENGSITAVSGSGIRIMSDSLIAFQPAIEEPSNMMPSRKTSSSMVETCCAVCCHLPRGSVNRRSTYSTECSVSISSTFPTPLAAPAGFLAMYCYPVASHNRCGPHHATASRGGPLYWFPPGAESGIRAIFCRCALDRVLATFAGADADDILDRR